MDRNKKLDLYVRLLARGETMTNADFKDLLTDACAMFDDGKTNEKEIERLHQKLADAELVISAVRAALPSIGPVLTIGRSAGGAQSDWNHATLPNRPVR